MTYIRLFDCFVVRPSVLMKANHKHYTGLIIFSLDINIVRKTSLYIYECVHVHVPVSASEMKSNSRTPSLCVGFIPNRTSQHHTISVITRHQCHKSRDKYQVEYGLLWVCDKNCLQAQMVSDKLTSPEIATLNVYLSWKHERMCDCIKLWCSTG